MRNGFDPPAPLMEISILFFLNPSLNTNTNYRCPGQNKFIFKCNKNNETPGIQSPVPELAMALVTIIGLGVEL